MKLFYVYVDWTTESTPRPFYVGKGVITRVKNLRRNKVHTRIAEKYGINREVVLETQHEAETFELERQLIAEHKTNMYRASEGHWGANLTDGGEGSSGRRYSLETRLKIKEARARQVCTPETRQKMSVTRKGRHIPRETLAKRGRRTCKRCGQVGHYAYACRVYEGTLTPAGRKRP